MLAFLDTLIAYIWIVDFAILFLFSGLAMKEKAMNSSLITQGIVVLLTGIIINYQGLVNAYVDPESNTAAFTWWCIGFAVYDAVLIWICVRFYQKLKIKTKPYIYNIFLVLAVSLLPVLLVYQYGTLVEPQTAPSFKVWRLAAYYVGLVFLNALVIYVLRKAHEFYNKPHRLVARTYILAFFIAANLQAIMFLELYLFHSNNFASIYHWGFASIGVCTTAVALLVALLAVYQFFRKSSREGLLWQL